LEKTNISRERRDVIWSERWKRSSHGVGADRKVYLVKAFVVDDNSSAGTIAYKGNFDARDSAIRHAINGAFNMEHRHWAALAPRLSKCYSTERHST
jgi:hypothetical protein